MSGIKVMYGNQTKRISEVVINYESLLTIIKNLFSLEDELAKSSFIRLCYVDRDNEKIEISCDEDFKEISNYHQKNCDNSAMKLEVLISSLKDSFNIDEMLNNMKLSESFSMVNKKDIDMNKHNDHIIKIEGSNKHSILASIEKPINLNDISKSSCKLDKEIQNIIPIITESKSVETLKIETIEMGANTHKPEIKEVFTQIEKNTKEIASHTEHINIMDNFTQVDNNIYERKEYFDESVVKTSKINLEKTSSGLNTEGFLINKIDEMLASRMKQMEKNLKNFFEIQQTKIFLQEPNKSSFNKNLQQINLDRINLINEKLKPQNQVEKIEHKIEFYPRCGNSNSINYENFYPDKIDLNQEKSVDANHCKRDSNKISDCCSMCEVPIFNRTKFICILCNNFQLCFKCEILHNQHPLLKVNLESKSFTSKEDVVNHFSQYKSQGISSKSILASIGNFFQSPFCLNLYPSNSLTNFAMKAGTLLQYELVIHNICNKDIQEEIQIIPINNRTFIVPSLIVNSLHSNEYMILTINLEAPNKLGKYEFEIIARTKSIKLICQPIKVEISVVNDEEQVKETNANLMFAEFKEILDLSLDKKLLLYKMISETIVKKDIYDILHIIKKYDYDIMLAFDELTLDDDENEKGEECY